MKQFLLIFLLTLPMCSISLFIHSQVCVPTTATPYSADMPGITNFTCNTINRTSQPIENYPNNSYVATGQTTTLVKGATYPVSITHTRDAVIFPSARNNVRIWIDYNNDAVLDTTTELAFGAYAQTFGTSSGNIVVPMSAVTGTVVMRVTAKMSSDAGHTFPSPCDNPPDPIDYHGEIEDYTVTLVPSTGIDNLVDGVNLFIVNPNPVSGNFIIQYGLTQSAETSLAIYDITGKKIDVTAASTQQVGNYILNLDTYELGIDNPGIYFAELSVNNHKVVKKFVVM